MKRTAVGLAAVALAAVVGAATIRAQDAGTPDDRLAALEARVTAQATQIAALQARRAGTAWGSAEGGAALAVGWGETATQAIRPVEGPAQLCAVKLDEGTRDLIGGRPIGIGSVEVTINASVNTRLFQSGCQPLSLSGPATSIRASGRDSAWIVTIEPAP